MTTPIADFVKKYIESDRLRLHMPGHKGANFLGYEMYDITEIDGADVLYGASGIIKESMNNAGRLFGTGCTLYSAEGSSLSVRAMLYLAVLYAESTGRKPKILAGRNAHKVFVTASALLDFDIEWIYPEDTCGIVSCGITAERLGDILSVCAQKPCAVYVTSPDYLGNIADIKGLSQVCRDNGVLLLVDNAHGAYLNFLPDAMHPMQLGADICCDSAHKTLPALTGAGYLHISKAAPEIIRQNAEKAMMLFASTSPSYLILQSLDVLNRYLDTDYRERLSVYCEKAESLKRALCGKGYTNISAEPLKVTFTPKSFGYTGTELHSCLLEKGIVCEFYDSDYLVLMLTPENGADALERLYRVMTGLEIKPSVSSCPPAIPRPKRGMSVRKAVMSRTERVPLEKSLGRIYAGICMSCPPAVPVAVCGEVIDAVVIENLRYYGETEAEVVWGDS